MMTEKAKNKIQLPVTAKNNIKTEKVFCIIKKRYFSFSFYYFSFLSTSFVLTVLYC